LTLALAVLACGLPTASSSPTPVPVQPIASTPTVAVPSLTLEQMKNAQYQLGTRDDHAMVQLTGGTYQQGTDTTTLDYARVTLTDFVSFGDLTGDGVNESAAMVFENFGGTGDFGMLAIYKSMVGAPVFVTSTLIDDRPQVNGIAIENGEVFLDAVTHGFNDPACCPALHTTRRYTFVNDQLRMMNYTTDTPDGKQRQIEVESPLNGAEAAGDLSLSGKVSIAPFENTLSYHIYDEAGNELSAGPVMVTALDMGAPGTFNETISLAGITAGTTIYLEVQDQSAADGSLLAMNAVKLFVK
jgi:hypothetical protein